MQLYNEKDCSKTDCSRIGYVGILALIRLPNVSTINIIVLIPFFPSWPARAGEKDLEKVQNKLKLTCETNAKDKYTFIDCEI